MSVVEMLTAMFGFIDVEKIKVGADDRSRVFVSKGHCAAATYTVMSFYGLLDDKLLNEYHQEGSLLTGHVNHGVPRVEHSTGALGHGINVATGCALALKSRGFHDASVLALVGDGEIQEGSVWEAMMLAVHHRLSNLITLVDNNRISSITHTHDVIDLRPLANRFLGFGLRVAEVDGHDLSAITDALKELRGGDLPGVIICNTVKGRGVPFAEEQAIWHYRTLNDQLLQDALQNL